MKSREMLQRATAPPDGSADFLAEKMEGFARVAPLHPAAAAWLQAHVSSESTWVGGALMVEMRYFPDLADAIIDAGFLFEREAYLN